MLALAAGIFIYVVLKELPDVNSLRDYRPPRTSTVWSRDGALMAELYNENRYPIDPRSLPAYTRMAFIAAEDDRFFEHGGLDFLGILRAAFANFREGRVVQGGSTITQQVAKSLLLSPERSLRRKVREAVLAIRIEKNLTKEEILNLYLNQIYLGHGAYGIEAAARNYFGVSASSLTIPQAALIAGLPQAPSRYDPYKNPEQALDRRAYVIRQMEKNGWITAKEAEEAVKTPLKLYGFRNLFKSIAPYYSEEVRRSLDAKLGTKKLLEGGLKITTSMDSRLQRAAEEALRSGLEEISMRAGYRGALGKVTDAAGEAEFIEGDAPVNGTRAKALVKSVNTSGITVMKSGKIYFLPAEEMEWALSTVYANPRARFRVGDMVYCKFIQKDSGELKAYLIQEPKVEGALICLKADTGEVLADVGGYDFSKSQFNRTTQAQRQVGSAIKPLIYAYAVTKGYTPATQIYDSPIVFDTADIDKKWKPKNYGEKFYGATTMMEALVKSRNVVTVKMLQDIGAPGAVDFLHNLGMESRIEPNLSLALGSPTVTVAEMASVYEVFATGGYRRPPLFIKRVQEADSTVIMEQHPEQSPPRRLDPAVACVVNQMMQEVIRSGTGGRAQGLPVPSAGKTGTTNENRDAWFIGVTPDLVTAVWIGYDDSQPLEDSETGGRAAAPIWKAFMEKAVWYYSKTGDFPVPSGIEFARFDSITGKLPNSRTQQAYYTAFIEGTAPVDPRPSGKSRKKREESDSSVDFQDPGALEMLR
ncbi:PBP1A family penicillin-binding protein [bacterium]|nr:MAG: PBP1A family penicillin-binding protein [bacterium]